MAIEQYLNKTKPSLRAIIYNMVAILHNIRSLHNVGSIFRTADGAGVEKLYLCGLTPSPIDRFNKPRPQLVKVSLGAEKSVLWEKCGQVGRLIGSLQKDGYKIIGLEIPGQKLSKINNLKNKKIALVVGHEVNGLPKSILDKCDKIVEIPMRGRKKSLNVAVAFGVAAYYLND